MRSCHIAAIFAIFAVFGVSNTLAQSTIFVNRSVVGGTRDGTSWSNAYRSLQDALQRSRSGDQIWVAKGSHYPDEGGAASGNNPRFSFNLIEGVRIYGGFNGSETLLAEREPAVHITTLSGDIDQNNTLSGNAYHVLLADGSTNPITSATVLDGFTVAAGNAIGNGYRENTGGGMLIATASPIISNCIFQGNGTVQYGGGVYIASSAAPVFNNCTFRQNNSEQRGGGVTCLATSRPAFNNCSFEGNTAGKGGGFYNYSSSSATLTGCSFLNNSATFSGGAMYNDIASSTLSNCDFQGNSAGYAGGIENFSSPITLTDCSFQGNRALTSVGGAIYFSGSQFATYHNTLTTCLFRDNSSFRDGGGIYSYASSLKLANCAFEGNRAGELGGALYGVNFSSLVLTNCALQGNSARTGGGLSTGGASCILNNCTFQGNAATSNGGAMHCGTLNPHSFTNCVVWNNKDSSGTGTASSSILVSGGLLPIIAHSLIQGYNPPGQGNLNGTGPSNDPGFVSPTDPADAPTAGGDLRVLDGSPAIDAGDGTAGASINATEKDLSGRPRFAGNGRIDMGAHEGGSGVTFAWRHPALLPDGDDNGNGVSNFGDYAAGGEPAAPDDPSLRPVMNGDLFTFSFRNNAHDMIMDLEKSDTLAADSWSRMVENTDYSLESARDQGAQTFRTIKLLDNPPIDPQMFYRQAFRAGMN
jgi:predicted outer membrane repeat protein